MSTKKPENYLKLAQQLNKLQLKLYGFTIEDMIAQDRIELSDEELQNLAADINTFYNRGFKDKLDKMIMQEMKSIAEDGGDYLQVQFMRGSISALTKLKQWCESQVPKIKTEQQENQPSPL